MNALRAGRNSVRFLHNHQPTRARYADILRVVTPLLSSSTTADFQIPCSSLSDLARGFASDKPAGRPKQHTGRAPARKSRAVQTKGDAIAQGKEPKPASKKTAKRPATKKTTKKTVTKKPRKAPVKKKRARKVLTPEQRARKDLNTQKTLVTTLKKASLRSKEPKQSAPSAWAVYFSERMKALAGGTSMPLRERASHVKDFAADFRALSPADREHYNHVAGQNKLANARAYAAWVSGLDAAAVREANNARHRLTRLGVKGYKAPIRDERQVKRPTKAHSLFLKERYASGDFAGVKVTEGIKLVYAEWRELPESEKKRFYATEEEERERYIKEMRDVYGVTPKMGDSKAHKAVA